MPSKLGQQMDALLRGQQEPPTQGSDKSAQIHRMYKAGLQQLRGTRNLHPEARRVEMARLYTTTRGALAKVMRDQTQADKERFAHLERSLWGYDLERATAADRATLDATIRDAQDRAAKLAKPQHAAKALHEAEQAGDSILARAIAKRAHDNDWDDVLHDYLATRPSAAEQYQQAGAIWARYNDANARMHDHMQYVVHAPAELRGLSPKDIEAMAEPGEPAA
ncbi:hypothetical protein [Streptomyces sp. NPDC017958]|uniref:hypothetical protein n=1 Tax=Streptomyces sp. NPDC017958 TaxID=3365021 RepID=UPI0037B8B7C5